MEKNRRNAYLNGVRKTFRKLRKNPEKANKLLRQMRCLENDAAASAEYLAEVKMAHCALNRLMFINHRKNRLR